MKQFLSRLSKKCSKSQEDESEIKDNINTARKYASEIKKAADAAIKGIDKDTELYIEKIKKHSEKNDERLDKMSQKLRLSLEENDGEAINAQLDEMMAMLDEDSDAKIRQEISDEKLKRANVEAPSEKVRSADNSIKKDVK